MTYFTFLGLFLLVPILILLFLMWRKHSQQKQRALPVSVVSASFVIGIHVILAITWTTPWDNYLVATGVWWYDPALVNGTTIGYVPIEEYAFFVLQPILTGLWLLFLMPYMYRPIQLSSDTGLRFRIGTTVTIGLIWFVFLGLLIAGFQSFTYLGLELVWALPPIMLQLAFGVDIFRNQWRLVISAILSATLFLSVADALAIGAGTWTIDPAQSTGFLVGNILPVEELIFFLLTNTLIVFGTTLALTEESKTRLKRLLNGFSSQHVRRDTGITFGRE